MSGTDLLGHAARALRQAYDGERVGAGFTRARILAAAQKKRRRGRWLIGSPLAVLLFAGTAWAQSGQWPRLWHAVAALFTVAPETARHRPEAPILNAHGDAVVRPVPQPGLLDAGSVIDEPLVAPLPPGPRLALQPEPLPSSAVQRSQGTRAPAAHAAPERTAPRSRAPAQSMETKAERAPPELAPPPAAAPLAPDPELALFRTAHDLHFSRAQPRAAVAASEKYLAAYPQGRFVPEARYNLALDWLELGDRQRARELLEPFARGAYDGYRREDAERLLKALH